MTFILSGQVSEKYLDHRRHLVHEVDLEVLWCGWLQHRHSLKVNVGGVKTIRPHPCILLPLAPEIGNQVFLTDHWL